MKSLILIIIYSVLIVALIFFSAFFSGCDMVYGTINEARLNAYISNKENKHLKSAKKALNLILDYDKTISIIIFLNDLVNVACETLAALLGYEVINYIKGNNPSVGSLISSAITVVLIVIFGEIIPKVISKNKNLELSIRYAKIITGCKKVFAPIVFVASKIGQFLLSPFKKSKIENPDVTSEELEEMVDVIEEEGIVDEEKAELLRGTIDYASTEAYEVMTPRVDIFAIDIEDDFDEIFENEELLVHSRIPVYSDTIDNIIGYVQAKDLIRLKLSNSNLGLKSILKKPLRFPRSAEINDILNEFKKTKNHFAIVLDEYGGVEGIITLEDILEEIVGEIWDEADDKDEPFKEISENEYIIDGSMNLIDFFEEFEIDYEEIETEYVTIGGYCIELLDDRFAKVGDVIQFKNLTLNIIAVDENNTIEKIKITTHKLEE